MKGGVKAADAVVAAFERNVEHFQIGVFEQMQRALHLFFDHVLLEGNSVDGIKTAGKGTFRHTEFFCRKRQNGTAKQIFVDIIHDPGNIKAVYRFTFPAVSRFPLRLDEKFTHLCGGKVVPIGQSAFPLLPNLQKQTEKSAFFHHTALLFDTFPEKQKMAQIGKGIPRKSKHAKQKPRLAEGNESAALTDLQKHDIPLAHLRDALPDLPYRLAP